MSIYITGDIHGMASDLRVRFGCIPNPIEEDKLIICGDFGAEYGSNINGRLKKECKKFPGDIIVLRGNHDNRYWANHTDVVTDANGEPTQIPQKGWHIEVSGFQKSYWGKFLVQDKYPNIKYIHDAGGIYNIEGYNFLMIPGAYSVDKDYRLSNHFSYESREQLTKEEMLNLSYHTGLWHNEIDFVCSHTAPMKMESYLRYLFLGFINQGTVDKTMEHWLDDIAWEVEQSNRFKQWYWGHYHDDKVINQYYTMLYNNVVPVERYL